MKKLLQYLVILYQLDQYLKFLRRNQRCRRHS